MTGWGLAVSFAIASASLAACVTYLLNPPWRVQASNHTQVGLVKRLDDSAGTYRKAPERDKARAEFEIAADAILKRSPNARASTAADAIPSIAVPMPRRRPIVAPHRVNENERRTGAKSQ